SLADLQMAFQHRASLMESNFRDIAKSQHTDFVGALDRATQDLQKRFWEEVYKTQREYERLIHEELRVVRQRAVAMQHAPLEPVQPRVAEFQFDYGRFAERFRGTEEYVKKNIQAYRTEFQGRKRVLDIGCGRGEFLEMMRDADVNAYGVELSEECVGLCRAKGLEVLGEDLFEHLASLPDGQLDGIFCAQVVEHLPPPRLPELVKLAALKLRRGGLVAIETPNPECLAIFASHFYLDPTHTRPVPHPFLAFLLEESGFGDIRVMKLSPAAESMHALASLPQDFRDAFFGGLDYAILGVKL
ncbi:MAG: class I SAM-dependent methyltransferase, partial [Bryobacteraceae bacterium]